MDVPLPVLFATPNIYGTALPLTHLIVIYPWQLLEIARSHRCDRQAGRPEDLEDLENLMTTGNVWLFVSFFLAWLGSIVFHSLWPFGQMIFLFLLK